MKSVQSQQLRYPRYGGTFNDITGHISHIFLLLLLITLNMSTATVLRRLKIQRKKCFFRKCVHNDFFWQNKTSIYLIFSGGREKEFCPGKGYEFYTHMG